MGLSGQICTAKILSRKCRLWVNCLISGAGSEFRIPVSDQISGLRQLPLVPDVPFGA
jgi:hypothetical protein